MEGFIPPEEEAALVQKAKAGHRDAFIRLYDRCYPIISIREIARCWPGYIPSLNT
jgi:hypothetical protein